MALKDLIVVGGGPAGSSAARAAAKAGLDVAVMEKEDAIAQTVRTSGVTWMDVVKEFGIPSYCYNPIRHYAFCSPNNSVRISSDQPMAAVLDVRRTYRFLAEQAKEAGAEILTGTSVTGALMQGGKVGGVIASRVSTPRRKHARLVRAGKDPGRHEIPAKMVIDASGFASTIAVSASLAKKWKRFGAGAEIEARVENLESDAWHLMVGEEYSPAGYAWIFPVSQDTARIGVGIGRPESQADPITRLRELLEKRPGPIGSMGRIEPLEHHYGLIPNEGLARKTVHDNLMLVGDSAGQSNPLVLEGIRYAIKFGRIAGMVAADAVKSGDTSARALEPYEKIWKKEILGKINSASKVQSRWIGLSDSEWDKELDIIRELSIGEFLDFIKADFGLSDSVRMAARHPKLAVRQLFGLIRKPR